MKFKISVSWKLAWFKFLKGHWTKEMPRKEGLYPVCDSTCPNPTEKPTPHHVVFVYMYPRYADPIDQIPMPQKPWAGFWWSEPLPGLPRPMGWDEKERLPTWDEKAAEERAKKTKRRKKKVEVVEEEELIDDPGD